MSDHPRKLLQSTHTVSTVGSLRGDTQAAVGSAVATTSLAVSLASTHLHQQRPFHRSLLLLTLARQRRRSTVGTPVPRLDALVTIQFVRRPDVPNLVQSTEHLAKIWSMLRILLPALAHEVQQHLSAVLDRAPLLW